MFITWISNSSTNYKGYYATWSASNSIITESVGTTHSPGDVFMMSYTAKGVFNSGNVFTAQLSDANGSFASPVEIGSVIATSSGSISAMIPSNTVNGVAYRVRVVSSSPAVLGSDNGQNITISSSTCLVPTGVSVSNITSTSAVVQWNTMSGAVKYQFHFKEANSGNFITKTVGSNSYQLTGLSPQTKYVYSVRSLCSTNPKVASAWAPKQKFTTSPLRLETPSVTAIEIYPNPTSSSSIVSFRLNQASRVVIDVFTEEGQLLQTSFNATLDEGNYQLTLDEKALNSGVNYVRISMGDEIVWKKIIKVE